jgi:hypothetical protein
METTIQKTVNRLSEIRDQIILLLSVYSKIKRTIFPGDGIISAYGNYSYEGLPIDAIPLQDKILKDFNIQFNIVESLIIDSAEQHKREINENKKIILRSILQDHMTWNKDIHQAIETLKKCFNVIIQLLNQLYPINDPKPILIPDTNALYYNSEIEKWKFKDFNKFTIALTPSVLKDLDKHKIEHKNELIRLKALKLISMIKEYRRRGKLTEGVIIRKDFVDLKSIAIEPDFSKSLKWLDEKNEDDRLIAEAFEIMRSNCNRPAYIVTADINLQNKCEVADFSFIEPLLEPEKKTSNNKKNK